MTENEASTRLEVIRAGLLSADVEVVSSEENIETIDTAIDAIEELQQYRAIGTPEECLQNKDFLRFLANSMNQKKYETYLRIYSTVEKKGRDEE